MGHCHNYFKIIYTTIILVPLNDHLHGLLCTRIIKKQKNQNNNKKKKKQKDHKLQHFAETRFSATTT